MKSSWLRGENVPEPAAVVSHVHITQPCQTEIGEGIVCFLPSESSSSRTRSSLVLCADGHFFAVVLCGRTRRRSAPIGVTLIRANGKLTFPCCLFLGRHQEECSSSCSIPAGGFQWATGTTLQSHGAGEKKSNHSVICFLSKSKDSRPVLQSQNH